MYIVIFVCLFLFSIMSFFNPKQDYRYYLLFFALSALLCFRYGQGTDYFSYNHIYDSFPTFDIAINNPYGIHTEWGYRFLCALFNVLHADFTVFVFCVSVFEMVMLHRFLSKYSHNAVFSLFLFFPTFYLTYYFSIIRQGIVLAVFLGLMVDCLFEKKWLKYIILNIILVFIHSSALFLLVVPIILKLRLKTIYVLLACGVLLGMVMSNGFVANFLTYIPFVGKQISNYLQSSISWMALLERVISFLIVSYLFYSKYNKEISKEMTGFMKIYSFGLALYFVLMPFPLISSRMMAYFKVFEIILIPALLVVFSKERLAIAAIVFAISTVMFFKNIGSYIAQGTYFDIVNVFTYPYISVFNKDDIWNYRNAPTYFS